MYNDSNIKDVKNITYVYNKLVNRVMYDGKKSLAEKILKNLLTLSKKSRQKVIHTKYYFLGVENASPF